MRKIWAIILLSGIASAIGYLMWQEEYRYSLPTPVPEGYDPPEIGAEIFPEGLPASVFAGRPVLLHFFNPDCPCSRFNLRHFHALVQAYGDRVDFRVLIPEARSRSKARKMLDVDLPVISDKDGQWAARCGVYATPQAVIFDETGRLYYRGNYNQARFCTLPGSNFASLSLDALLAGQPAPDWGALAEKAYGCQIPDSSAQQPTGFFIPTHN